MDELISKDVPYPLAGMMYGGGDRLSCSNLAIECKGMTQNIAT